MHIKGNEPLKLSDHANEEESDLKKKCLAVKKFVKNVHASPFKDLGVIITAQAEDSKLYPICIHTTGTEKHTSVAICSLSDHMQSFTIRKRHITS